VGLVLGQHHRTLGQVPELLVEVGQHLLAVGVAFGDQPGSPPLGDLADAPVQGPQAHGGATQVQVQQRDGPGVGLGEQPTDPCSQPPAAQPGPPNAGPIGQPAGALLVVTLDPAAHRPWVAAQQLGDPGCRPVLLGEQDHDQPVAHPVGALQQPEQVVGVTSRAGALGVHAGRTHTGPSLVRSL
jgi:hypothetical protein